MTITLDELIARLEELKKEHGGDTPVLGSTYEFRDLNMGADDIAYDDDDNVVIIYV